MHYPDMASGVRILPYFARQGETGE